MNNSKVEYPFTMEDLLGTTKPWSLASVLEQFVKSSEMLLKRDGYDGGDYEELEHCVFRGKEIIAMLSNTEQSPKQENSSYQDVFMDGNNWEEDFPHENGSYFNTCTVCGNLFMGHKRRVLCKECVVEK